MQAASLTMFTTRNSPNGFVPPFILGNIQNPTIIKRQWNGDPMDWETWPTGRPGPFVSEARMQEVIGIFQRCEQERNEQSPTNENIMHIAEFSLSGRGEPELSHKAPE